MTRARLHLPRGTRNKTEAAFEADVLKPMMLAGDLVWYEFEPLTFRLAKKTSYTPDFVALGADGSMNVWEVKGYWKGQEHNRVKLKVAAAQFPMFPFRVAMRGGKGEPRWKIEEISAS